MESANTQAVKATAGAKPASGIDPNTAPVAIAQDDVAKDTTLAPADTPNFVSWLTGLRTDDRRFLRLLLIVFMIGIGVEWILIVTQQPRPPGVERGDAFQRYFSVDINTATWIDWMQLEGIGPTLAHRIEADRKLNGPFQSIDDIQRVPGIGPVKLEQVRPWLTITHEAEQPGTEPADAVP